MQPVSRQQVNRNKYVRITSFEGKNDSFRIAIGDAAATYRRQQQLQKQQPMAPAAAAVVDGAGSAGAGEISPESSFTTVILSPLVVTNPTTTKSPEEREMEEEDQEEGEHSSSSSSCSSPPTHPAFYSPRAAAAAHTGTENVCHSSMAAPFSSPLAALLAHKAPARQSGVTAETVMLERFLNDGDGDGGEGDAEERRVLENVDINFLAAPSNDTGNGGGQVVSPDYFPLG